jgi:hypothetical protein
VCFGVQNPETFVFQNSKLKNLQVIQTYIRFILPICIYLYIYLIKTGRLRF